MPTSESCESDKCLAESFFFSVPYLCAWLTYDKRCFLDSFTTRLRTHKEKVRFNPVKYSRTNAWCYAKYRSTVEVFFINDCPISKHTETTWVTTYVCTCLLTCWYALIVTYYIRGKWEVPIKYEKLTNLLTVPRKAERKLKRWRSALFLCGHMMTGNFVTQYINWTCFMQFLCLGCFALLFGSFSAWFGLY